MLGQQLIIRYGVEVGVSSYDLMRRLTLIPSKMWYVGWKIVGLVINKNTKLFVNGDSLVRSVVRVGFR